MRPDRLKTVQSRGFDRPRSTPQRGLRCGNEPPARSKGPRWQAAFDCPGSVQNSDRSGKVESTRTGRVSTIGRPQSRDVQGDFALEEPSDSRGDSTSELYCPPGVSQRSLSAFDTPLRFLGRCALEPYDLRCAEVGTPPGSPRVDPTEHHATVHRAVGAPSGSTRGPSRATGTPAPSHRALPYGGPCRLPPLTDPSRESGSVLRLGREPRTDVDLPKRR